EKQKQKQKQKENDNVSVRNNKSSKKNDEKNDPIHSQPLDNNNVADANKMKAILKTYQEAKAKLEGIFSDINKLSESDQAKLAQDITFKTSKLNKRKIFDDLLHDSDIDVTKAVEDICFPQK
ncbi:hypothetical protein RFI_13284, partial [Reticulomyxa filosa]